MALHSRPSGGAQAAALVGGRPQAEQGAGQCLGVGGPDKQAGVGGDDLGIAANARGHDGQAGGHRLQERQRHPLGQRRQDEQSGACQQGGDVADGAQEADVAGQAQLGRQAVQVLAAGAVAGHFQAEGGIAAHDQGRGAQQGGVVLLGAQAGDDDGRPVRPRAGEGEALQVDAVPDSADLARGYALAHREAGAVVRDADETVHPGGGEVDQRGLPAPPVMALAVAGVDDPPNAGQAPGEGAVQVRAVVVRVDDVRAPAAQQAGQAEDESRPQAGRDAQGRHRPAGGLDLLGHRARMAQGDEVQVKALAVGVAGELDEQLLQAADVEPERDMGDPDFPRNKSGCDGDLPTRFPLEQGT